MQAAITGVLAGGGRPGSSRHGIATLGSRGGARHSRGITPIGASGHAQGAQGSGHGPGSGTASGASTPSGRSEPGTPRHKKKRFGM